jgi:RecJ-like exonuclease
MDINGLREFAGSPPEDSSHWAKIIDPPTVLAMLDRIRELEGHLEVAICKAGKEERLKIEAESRVEELEGERETLKEEVSVQKRRANLRQQQRECSDCTGKGTGLLCSECVRGVADERDTLHTECAHLKALLRECMGVMQIKDYEKWETLAPKIDTALQGQE